MSAGRLLILDDDPMVGTVLTLFARKFGFDAEMMSQPSQFFDRVMSWQPTHVAVDLSMPELDGRQVLARLAQMRCPARIIISSGADLPEMNAVLQAARDLGLRTAGVLAKPYAAQTLRRLLQIGSEGADAPAVGGCS